MEKPRLLVTAAIGMNDGTWYDKTFDLGEVDPEEEFNSKEAEEIIAGLVDDEGIDCCFIAYMFHEEQFDMVEDDFLITLEEARRNAAVTNGGALC